jgi:hypothetical protein
MMIMQVISRKANFPLKEKCPRAYLQGKYHAAHHVFFLVL